MGDRIRCGDKHRQVIAQTDHAGRCVIQPHQVVGQDRGDRRWITLLRQFEGIESNHAKMNSKQRLGSDNQTRIWGIIKGRTNDG